MNFISAFNQLCRLGATRFSPVFITYCMPLYPDSCTARFLFLFHAVLFKSYPLFLGSLRQEKLELASQVRKCEATVVHLQGILNQSTEEVGLISESSSG